jgi:hypothetical protein
MTECWSEGEWRAYLDRECAADAMERMSAHLEECAACQMLYGEVSGRAQRISEWMAALPEPELSWVPRVAPQVRPRRWIWAAAGVAVAAGLALMAVAVSRRAPAPPQQQLVTEPRRAEPEIPAATVAAAGAASPEEGIRRRPAARPRRPRSRTDFFLALDDEPIENGTMVRVALGPESVPADVIVGPDGRARAIRLVNWKTN